MSSIIPSARWMECLVLVVATASVYGKGTTKDDGKAAVPIAIQAGCLDCAGIYGDLSPDWSVAKIYHECLAHETALPSTPECPNTVNDHPDGPFGCTRDLVYDHCTSVRPSVTSTSYIVYGKGSSQGGGHDPVKARGYFFRNFDDGFTEVTGGKEYAYRVTHLWSDGLGLQDVETGATRLRFNFDEGKILMANEAGAAYEDSGWVINFLRGDDEDHHYHQHRNDDDHQEDGGSLPKHEVEEVTKTPEPTGLEGINDDDEQQAEEEEEEEEEEEVVEGEEGGLEGKQEEDEYEDDESGNGGGADAEEETGQNEG